MPKKQTFLEYLVERGLIPSERAKEIVREAERSGRAVENLVVESDILTQEKLLAAKSEYLGIPHRIVSAAETISPRVLKEIPEEAARTYQMIPLALEGKELFVGMVNPEDVKAEEALRFLTVRAGLSFKKFIISHSDFQKILARYRGFGGEVGVALKELKEELAAPQRLRGKARRAFEEALEEEAPITKIVSVILRHAVEGRASDVHIEPTRTEVRVRFRVDGVLYTSIILPLQIHAAVLSRIKILADLKIDETRIPQDGRFNIDIEGKWVDLRVATLPTMNGEKVAIRILDPTVGLKTLQELGLMGRNLGVVEQNVRRPFGVVLLTGPTGSGKSTTLYAILKILNREGMNIVSLEDPIEYFIDGVNQSQVHEEIGFTFATGLRHVLRGDPNIIMVGEIRDIETARLVVHAGLTGHLVLSTLHTNNAVGVIPRLVDMGIERFLLPPVLILAMAQRLIPRLCPHCRKPVPAPASWQKLIAGELANLPEEERKKVPYHEPFTLFQAPGCGRCGRRGRIGRMAIFEALAMTRALEDVILKEPSETAIEREARRQGMSTMLQDGVLKALDGSVALDDVLRAVEESELQV